MASVPTSMRWQPSPMQLLPSRSWLNYCLSNYLLPLQTLQKPSEIFSHSVMPDGPIIEQQIGMDFEPPSGLYGTTSSIEEDAAEE